MGINQITHHVTDQTTGQTTDRTTDRTTDQATDRTTDQATDRTADQATDRTADQTTDRTTDQTTDQTAGRTTDQITDQVTESISGSSHLIGSLEVLHGLFENGKTALSEQFIRWKLWKRWTEYAGSSIGAVSEPVDYQRGVLYVWVRNASWMQQLVFMLELLKRTINKRLGFEFVHAIHLTLDRKTVPSGNAQKKEIRESMKKLLTEGDDS